MAIDVGPRGKRPRPIINVTPLVDVVLVLLIIFMVVAPLLDDRLDVSLPSEQTAPTRPPDAQILVELLEDGTVVVNGFRVPRAELEPRMRSVLRGSREKVVFFRADYDSAYGDAVTVVDLLKGAGARTVGTVLTRPETP